QVVIWHASTKPLRFSTPLAGHAASSGSGRRRCGEGKEGDSEMDLRPFRNKSRLSNLSILASMRSTMSRYSAKPSSVAALPIAAKLSPGLLFGCLSLLLKRYFALCGWSRARVADRLCDRPCSYVILSHPAGHNPVQ